MTHPCSVDRGTAMIYTHGHHCTVEISQSWQRLPILTERGEKEEDVPHVVAGSPGSHAAGVVSVDGPATPVGGGGGCDRGDSGSGSSSDDDDDNTDEEALEGFAAVSSIVIDPLTMTGED